MEFYKDFDLKELVEGVDYIENLPDGKYYFEKYCGKYSFSIKNGKNHGVEEEYYRDGNVGRTTNYYNGCKQGVEVFYNNKGIKTLEKYYENGFLLFEIHFQSKEDKKVKQIKILEQVLEELKGSVKENQQKNEQTNLKDCKEASLYNEDKLEKRF